MEPQQRPEDLARVAKLKESLAYWKRALRDFNHDPSPWCHTRGDRCRQQIRRLKAALAQAQGKSA